MRPISLKIEGFTSFKNEVDIDFSQLEVFAITGDNGAGKSSILEAMLFALYGKTHRLGKEKKDLVSLGSDKAAVMFEFAAGGNRYRITRSFKQKGNPFMKLETLKDENWTTLAEQAQVNDEVEKILRLPFDAFTKAVLIPQGHFDALLKPREPKERRKTLIELFDLGIYDRMKTRANEIAQQAGFEESEILHQFESRYLDATPEKRKEIAQEKKSLAAESKKLSKEKETLLKQLERVREVLALKKDHLAVTARAADFHGVLVECEGKLETAASALDSCRARELEEIPMLEREIRMLSEGAEKLKRLADREKSLSAADKSLERFREQDRDARKQILDMEKTRDRASSEIVKIETRLQKHGFQESLFAKLESLFDEFITLSSWRNELSKLSAQVQNETPAVESLQKEIKILAEKNAEASRQYERVKNDAAAARRESEVLDLKLHLHRGDHCPVCGTHLQSPVEVPKSRVREIQELNAKTEKKCALLEAELKELQSLSARKTAEHHWRDQSLRDEEKQIAALVARIEAKNKDLVSKIKMDPAAAADELGRKLYEDQKALRSEYRALQLELREKENENREREKQIHEITVALKIAASEIARLDTERKKMAAEIAALQSQIPLEIASIKPAAVADSISAVDKRRKDITRRIEQLRGATRDAEVGVARLQQDHSHASKALKQEQTQLARLDRRLEGLSEKENGYSDLYAETLAARVQTATAESSQLERRLGEVSQQLDQIDRLLEEVKEQRERLDSARKRKETYGLLFRHLAGNQLQDYVVSALLQQLVESANQFLKGLTQGRYLLDLEKDNFVVQDSWASGQSRIVETLSGGESFVVSLALALALSDFMKAGAALESLFIDEGFGSLHRDKLDLVYEALGALSGTGKLIGLVTHLEELAGRFPARLHVFNTPSGSEVHLEKTETEW